LNEGQHQNFLPIAIATTELLACASKRVSSLSLHRFSDIATMSSHPGLYISASDTD